MTTSKPDQAAPATSRLIGVYPDGGTFVTWFKSANSPSSRRWEIVSVSMAQVEADKAEAKRYLGLPALISDLADVEIKLDAALHPTFDIDFSDVLAMLNEAHAQLRRLLGMPAVTREPSEQAEGDVAAAVYPERSE